MLREGAAAGHIHAAETAIVEMALRLGDRRVSAVMTPRTQVEWLDLDDRGRREPPQDPRQRLFALSGGRGGAQQVVGIVQVKDLLDAALAGRPFDLRAAAAAAALSAEHGDGAARARDVQDARASRWRWSSTNTATSKGW